MEYTMLSRRFVRRLLIPLPSVRDHRHSLAVISLRVHRLILLVGVAFFTLDMLLPLSLSAQLTPNPIAERIRTQLEARKPPPEPVPTPTPGEVTTPPVDANADPANDNIEGAGIATPAPDVVPAPPVKSPKFIPPKLYIGKELLHAVVLLTRFYEGRDYQPAWTSVSGPLPYVTDLLNSIQDEAGREGLHASDYHLAKIKAMLADLRLGQTPQHTIDPILLADLDFLLTDAFLMYGADASLGRVNLDALGEAWFIKNNETDLVLQLQTALGTNSIVDTIRNFPPKHAGYVRLREALARYRDIAAHGGWSSVPPGPVLAQGASGDRVAKLHARLITSGDLHPLPADNPDGLFDTSSKQLPEPALETSFDLELEQAVQRFQRRHGLSANGVVGSETLAALNVPVETRVRQIIMNMERWRRLPQDLGRRHISVNVPNFMLEVVENDQLVMDMKVVVGKMIEERATPTFSAKMSYLVLNPYWYVPKNIAEKELWPMHQRNPRYFERNNFHVRRIPVGYKQVVDPNAIDGAKKSVRTYDYVIRQGPGPKNALGRVKFMFPNPYSVYLHDTPSKELFNRTVRAFSHGCIRIEKPIDLAEYVLRDSPKWSKNAIQATLHRDKEQTVYLPEPLPVHIQYWTAWVDDEGSLQFRNDIYHYDRLGPSSGPTRVPKTTQTRQHPRPKPHNPAPKEQLPGQPTTPVPVEAAVGQ